MHPHRRRQRPQDARGRVAGVDAGGGSNKVPCRDRARHHCFMQQEAEEGCGDWHVVRAAREGRLRPTLRPSLRGEAEPSPREILPDHWRLVRKDVDGGAEGAHVADSLLPLVPERSSVEHDTPRCLLPLPPRRPSRHLGLLLPNERGVADTKGLRLCPHLLERSGAGPACGCRRCRRRHHLATAVRWPCAPHAKREEHHRPDLRA
mmetsp:Transcript_7085/g.21543  ORF Transcript_7085/g.21543 Transcript_7085/m.21543 type:complete len:205 (+) Transcript_7085:995-1609(+)